MKKYFINVFGWGEDWEFPDGLHTSLHDARQELWNTACSFVEGRLSPEPKLLCTLSNDKLDHTQEMQVFLEGCIDMAREAIALELDPSFYDWDEIGAAIADASSRAVWGYSRHCDETYLVKMLPNC